MPFIFRSSVWVFLYLDVSTELFGHIKCSHNDYFNTLSVTSSVYVNFQSVNLLTFLLIMSGMSLLLCMFGNLLFDAKHCDFTFFWHQVFCIPLNILELCPEMPLGYFGRVGPFAVPFVRFIVWDQKTRPFWELYPMPCKWRGLQSG